MKRLKPGWLLAVLLTTTAHATEETYSAVRLPGEDFREAKARVLGKRPAFPRGSAEQVAKSVGELDLKLATPWDSLGSLAAVNRAFGQVRDARFMTVKDNPTFQRRISWLYPDDGCWTRAASADLKYVEMGFPNPTKIFIFGNLGMKTPNSRWGEVGWWYHVAPVISFQEMTYVLDPAVEPKYPLPLKEWVSRISGGPESVTIAICVPGTYTPGGDCARSEDSRNDPGIKDQNRYLKKEWKRVMKLKRDPEKELGEHPPWNP